MKGGALNTILYSFASFRTRSFCIRLYRFVLVCIEGTGHNGMVMGNVNVHSFLWKECNYCICLF